VYCINISIFFKLFNQTKVKLVNNFVNKLYIIYDLIDLFIRVIYYISIYAKNKIMEFD
jgi:hypothetical protein